MHRGCNGIPLHARHRLTADRGPVYSAQPALDGRNIRGDRIGARRHVRARRRGHWRLRPRRPAARDRPGHTGSAGRHLRREPGGCGHGQRRAAPVRRARGGRAAARGTRHRAAGSVRRPGHRGHRRARDRGHRHPGGRAPQPGPGRHPERPRRLRQLPAGWADPHPAQHRLPRGDGAGGKDRRRARHRHRRGLLPGAHRRGQGDDGAVRAAADRLGPDRARRGPRQRAVPPGSPASSSC